MNTKRIQTLVEYIFALGLALITYLFFSVVINTEEKYVTVPLTAKIDTRFTFIQPPPKSVTVLLKGSRAALSRISVDNVAAVIDFSLYDAEGIYTENIQIIRSGVFLDLNNIEVAPNPSTVESNIERKITKTVSVLPVFVNAPPPQYGFQGFSVVPTDIKVTGPRSVVLPIEVVETQEINLANETRDFTSIVRVINMTNVALDVEPEEVEVTANIQQVITVRTINEVSMELVNLSDDLLVTTDIPTASLIVQGRRVNVNDFTPTIVLDASSISESGTYTLIPTLSRATNIEIISLSPTSVLIEVETKNIEPIESPAVPNIDFLDDIVTDEPPATIVDEKEETSTSLQENVETDGE